MLSFISSRLGTHCRSTGSACQGPVAPEVSGTSGGSSKAFELHTDPGQWEVQWQELTVMRRIGRGSYGSVYLADWNCLPVAVKVLISRGKCSWQSCMAWFDGTGLHDWLRCDCVVSMRSITPTSA